MLAEKFFTYVASVDEYFVTYVVGVAKYLFTHLAYILKYLVLYVAIVDEYLVSILGQDKGNTVKYNPLPEGVPTGKAQRNS